MRFRSLVLVVAGLAATVVLPLAALDALHRHLAQVHMDHTGGVLNEPRMQLQLALFALSLVPVLGAATALARWVRGMRALGLVTRAGAHASYESLRYRVLTVPEPVFFTAGLIRGRVYASSGARTSLSAEAFRAALLHETAHQDHRDVLARFLLHLCRGAYGWLPKTGAIFDAIALEIECRADDAALAAGASRKGLFEAIAAASASTRAGVSLASEGVTFRLERLAQVRTITPRIDPRPLAGVVGVAFSIPVLAHAALILFCDLAML